MPEKGSRVRCGCANGKPSWPPRRAFQLAGDCSSLSGRTPSGGGCPAGIFGLEGGSETSRVHLLPAPVEATVSYGTGTSTAPSAIARASQQVDLFDFTNAVPWRAGVHLHVASEEVAGIDEETRALVRTARGLTPGTRAHRRVLEEVNSRGDRQQEILASSVDDLLGRQRIVGVVGGDHSVACAAIAAHAGRFPGICVLQVDAHADLRASYEGFAWSHASAMYNVLSRLPGVARLVQVGVRDLSPAEKSLIDTDERIHTFFGPWLGERKLAGVPFTETCATIVDSLLDEVYVTFDIDGLDPTLCPHTGTPVPDGLSFSEATFLLAQVAGSGRRVVGFDLCEVVPGPPGDDWDANVAARLLYKMIGVVLTSCGDGTSR